MLQWARMQNPPLPWDAVTCNVAARGGHLEVLKWARGQDPPCPWDSRTLTSAANGGHLELLKWVQEHDPTLHDLWNVWTCANAADGGCQVLTMMWVRK